MSVKRQYYWTTAYFALSIPVIEKIGYCNIQLDTWTKIISFHDYGKVQIFKNTAIVKVQNFKNTALQCYPKWMSFYWDIELCAQKNNMFHFIFLQKYQ